MFHSPTGDGGMFRGRDRMPSCLVESGGTSTHIDSPVIGGLIWINMMNQWESAKRSSTNPGNFGKLFHPTTSINSI
jgi:hypothetical protein